jgi:hypothetical protein
MTWRESAKAAVTWLGLATLASLLMLGIELWARAPAAAGPGALPYLAVLSLCGTLVGSLIVGWAHAARLAFGKRPVPTALAIWALLGVAVLPVIVDVSAALTAGAWIARQPHVRELRWAMAGGLLLCWQLLWLWHAFGASDDLRARMQARLRLTERGARVAHAAFAIGGVLVLVAVSAAVAGVLGPYARIAQQLLFPCWLICATLAFSLRRVHSRAAQRTAVVVLCACTWPLAVRVAAPERLAAVRSEALQARGFIGFADALVNPQGDQLVRLDFPRLGAAACPPPRKEASLALGAGQRRNVILISVDAMRRDALGKRYGKRVVAPNLEAFARESLSFSRATAAASATLLSLSSALSGRSLNQLLFLREVPPTVFSETRRLLPIQRIFLPSWTIFEGKPFRRMLTRRVVTHRGPNREDRAKLLVTALQAARQKGERGLFWMHLADPHKPYRAHGAFNFGADPVARYYGEVALADAVIGRVLDYLRQDGWLEDSLVVVFADHGEALGENGGYFGHGTQLVGRYTDVPLIVHYPGVVPRVDATPAILTQVAPTVLHFLDRPIPEGVAACSLLRAAADRTGCLPPISMLYGVPTETFANVLEHPVQSLAAAERRLDALIEWRRFPPSLAAISSDRRYVRDLQTGVEHLYRHPDPSTESEDLISSEPDVLQEFRAQVADWRSAEAQRVACQIRAR